MSRRKPIHCSRRITDAELKFYLDRAHQLRAEAFLAAIRWVARKLSVNRATSCEEDTGDR